MCNHKYMIFLGNMFFDNCLFSLFIYLATSDDEINKQWWEYKILAEIPSSCRFKKLIKQARFAGQSIFSSPFPPQKKSQRMLLCSLFPQKIWHWVFNDLKGGGDWVIWKGAPPW